MDARAQEAQSRYLKRQPVKEIAEAMGISRARVYQLLQLAKQDSHAQVQVTGISDHIDREALAGYLRRALATAGITPGQARGE